MPTPPPPDPPTLPHVRRRPYLAAALGVQPSSLPPFASVAVLEVYVNSNATANGSSPFDAALVRFVYNGAVVPVSIDSNSMLSGAWLGLRLSCV